MRLAHRERRPRAPPKPRLQCRAATRKTRAAGEYLQTGQFSAMADRPGLRWLHWQHAVANQRSRWLARRTEETELRRAGGHGGDLRLEAAGKTGGSGFGYPGHHAGGYSSLR